MKWEEVVSKSFRTESIKIYTPTTTNTRSEATQRVMAESSQNSDITAPSGKELYHLQFSLQAVSPETFGCTLLKGSGRDLILSTIAASPRGI
jgi:hypothetical protein